ncbi:response regulator transcription factor [Granulicoccus sp. GXG6511]|uniref:response regulator transcription factor n=1 Tax=Granulicoccus sp. GXG6511 TaxID=3381351 RepID=UPI003D7ECE2F
MIRVILADDHPVFLAGLEALLDTVEGIHVVGSATDGTELIDLARSTDFEVAVIDLDMPGADGATAAEQILRLRADAGVLILTMHDDTASLTRCLRAGARGYILKGAGAGAIARAVAAIADGDTVIAGDLGRSVRTAVATQSLAGADGLTLREREVLELVRQGLDNPEIARRLHISVKTVQNNVSALLTKLQVSSRIQLIARG